jgi:hypothetical protein
MARENARAGQHHPRRNLTNLTAICRMNVVNPTTVRLVAPLADQPPAQPPSLPSPQPEPAAGILSFRAGDPAFFALLGTANGKGAARMLAEYPRMFGWGVIARAVVDPHGNPNICCVLERGPAADTPQPPRTPTPTSARPISRKEARRQRRRQERTV